MMSHKVKDTDTEEELKNAFKVFDPDNSGTISSEELRKVLTSLGEDMTDAEIDEMIKLADVNGDGMIDCEKLCSAPPPPSSLLSQELPRGRVESSLT